jgi:CheY-like chemotaxis protein
VADASGNRDRTILVIDGNARFLQVVRPMLREFGFGRILEFTDPSKAFLALTRQHVDVILSGLVVSPIDGFKFAEMVRHANPVVNRVVPIILMIDHARRETVEKAIQYGIDEVLVKPFSVAQLFKRLERVLDRARVYIKTPSGYFGPDRRRRNDPHYTGPDRRQQNLAVIVDEAVFREMQLGATESTAMALREKVKAKPSAPVLVGPITTIPVSEFQPDQAGWSIPKVPTSLKEPIVEAEKTPIAGVAPAVTAETAPKSVHPDDVWVLDL